MRQLKTLWLFVLLASLLQASTLSEAKALYEQQRYEAAYGQLHALFRDDMANVEVNLYLGRSALATRRYNEAIAAFERVLLVRPNHAVARFELGRAYFRAGLYDQAETAFERVLALPVPERVRQSVLQHVALIAQSRQKHHVNLFVSAGLLDDSNIRYDSDEVTDLGVNAGVSGRAHFQQLAFTHLYNLETRDRLWQTRANLYNQNYFDISRESRLEATRPFGGSDFDITYPSIQSGYFIRERDYTLYLPIGYSMLQYGGESLFRDWSIAAEWEKSFSDSQGLMLSGSLTDRAYLATANEVRDALIFDLRGTLRQAQSDGLWLYRGGFRLENTKESDANDVTTLSVGTQRVKTLEHGWAALFGGDVRYRADSEESPVADKKRQDTILDLSASINMPLEATSYLSLGASYSRGFSNIDDFDYIKRVFMVSYNHLFGDSAFKRIKD